MIATLILTLVSSPGGVHPVESASDDPRAHLFTRGLSIQNLTVEAIAGRDAACWIADSGGGGEVCRKEQGQRPSCLRFSARRTPDSVVDRARAIELMCRDAGFFRRLTDVDTVLGRFIELGGFAIVEVPLETGRRGVQTGMHITGLIGRRERKSPIPGKPLKLVRFYGSEYVVCNGAYSGAGAHVVRFSGTDTHVHAAIDLAPATGFASWAIIWSEYGGGNGAGKERVHLSVLDLRQPPGALGVTSSLLMGRGEWSKGADIGSGRASSCQLTVRRVVPGANELDVEECPATGDHYADVRDNIGRWCFAEEGWQRCERARP